MDFWRRPIERWLAEGWPPWRIGYSVVTALALVAAIYGYASHPHHPGAVWYVVAAVGVVAAYALIDGLRWRTKFNRLASPSSANRARVTFLTRSLSMGEIELSGLEIGGLRVARVIEAAVTTSDDDIEKAWKFQSDMRERARQWKTSTEKALRIEWDEPHALLFRSHAHIQLNRTAPNNLDGYDQQLWEDIAGCLQWLAQQAHELIANVTLP